ncbi:hypothetical protein BDS110ZK4_30220 [Bradyrhizobium diazoefficiens]|uniref:Uncharacterized protein n=1 Tax=Bradyrhizobium diazoefficiens TaxID=1355477 RepID=A0A810CRG6_9BRAD|nr:hypothetical protein XF4B_45050 [Bradyrhizobium diazoefficiens]BCE91672.1 hypothetical protein XF10B_44700 [Bradyrhizobium diazoefficiens]
MVWIEREWRAELVARHPLLFHPDAGKSCGMPGHPICGPGWRDILDRCCIRISALLWTDDRFRFLEIREERGSVQFEWRCSLPAGAQRLLHRAIALAEARSLTTCEVCGDVGRLHVNDGWHATRCAVHATGQLVQTRPGDDDLHMVQETGGANGSVLVARYDRATDSLVYLPPGSRGIKG